MNFFRFQQLKQQAIEICREEGRPFPEPGQMNPIVLALIGDSVFTFYVRMRLLSVSSHVQVIHTIAAKMVSAVMQSKALYALETGFSEKEAAMARRGRNAKSMVPKSASVNEYRAATALETLFGWLLLTDQEQRLKELLEQAFREIAREMQEQEAGSSERKTGLS